MVMRMGAFEEKRIIYRGCNKEEKTIDHEYEEVIVQGQIIDAKVTANIESYFRNSINWQ